MQKKTKIQPKKKKKENPIKIIPIGGLGTIGKNITVFEYKEDIIIVDCGIMFPTSEMPGIDYIIPDFSYLIKNQNKIRGMILTHGHEDHIGAVSHLLNKINVPIYATKLTLGLIQSRLLERVPPVEPTLNEVKPRDRVSLGKFHIEFIRVNHSIADCVALAIQTEVGTIIHTGDFKIDFSPVDGEVTDIYRFSEYGEKGVLLLMSDSTNAERGGFTRSEAILSDKLVDIFSSAKSRIIVVTFASNINRIQQVFDAAKKYHRKVVISGLTMQKNIEIAKNLGYLNFPDEILINVEEANNLPHKKLVILGTGTQGEPMSALSRMANGTHRHFRAVAGDTIAITASVIPGNQRMVSNVINSLMLLGADVFYDQEKDIHVSGHGSAKELKLMLSITKPQFFMPVHGEYKHMRAHSKIAESLNIHTSKIILGQNGDILELTPKSFKRKSSIDLSQIYIDGNDRGDIDGDVIKERLNMSKDGIIFISMIIAEGMVITEPEIITKGFTSNTSNTLVESLKREIRHKLNRMLKSKMTSEKIEAGLKQSLSNVIYKTSRRNPILVIKVQEI